MPLIDKLTQERTNGMHETTPELLRSLVEFAKSVDLEEVIWEKGAQRIAFRRRLGPAAVPAARSAAAAGGKAAPSAVDASKSKIITSPMVGTFWRAASKDRPPLVVEGGTVTPGQRVALVEAMKIPKDVISNVAGRIVEVFVENGKPVEYGQKLFRIELE